MRAGDGRNEDLSASATLSRGSSSFAAAARLLDPATRADTVRLYAWCRHCDDEIDGQWLGHAPAPGTGSVDPADAAARLARLRERTLAACAGAPSGDAVFDGLAEVVARHQVPARHLLDHLEGFRMDVDGLRPADFDQLMAYCYGVAGVVGLMMARIMGVRDAATLDRACDLGLAFQLTNIARDVLDDARAGRRYLPADWLAAEGVPEDAVADPAHRRAVARVAARLLHAAEPYYDSARVGLRALPPRAAWAIAAALSIYRDIGLEVARRGPRAWDARVSTGSLRKLWRVSQAGGVALAVRLRGDARPAPVRGALWVRPGGAEPGRPA